MRRGSGTRGKQPPRPQTSDEDEDDDEEVEGLTLYEMNREPLIPPTKSSETSLQVRSLNMELTCPICLGILRTTMTVMECLHRFCSECISTCLRLGKKECPTCRVHCSSRRHLRPDVRFDSLIRTIYPDLDVYEAQEDKLVADINKSYNRKALTDSVKRGMARQAAAASGKQMRKRKAASIDGDGDAAMASSLSSFSASPSPSTPTPSASASRPTKVARKTKKKDTASKGKRGKTFSNKPAKELPGEVSPFHIKKNEYIVPPHPSDSTKPEIVNVIMERHPLETRIPELDKKFLKLRRDATVQHLAVFLHTKFPTAEFLPPNSITPESFVLTLLHNPSRVAGQQQQQLVAQQQQVNPSNASSEFTPVVLEAGMSLDYIEAKYWVRREDITLFYALKL